MNNRKTPFSTRRSLHAAALMLAVGGSIHAQTKPLPRWLAAPGAADRFDANATGFRSVNQHLTTALSTLAYPDLVGVPGYVNNNASHQAAYATNLQAVLGQGTADYAGTSTDHTGWGFRKISHIYDPAKDAEGFIASNDRYAVISIRGSESGDAYSWCKDWLESDLNIGPVHLGNGRIVHGGFWLHAQAIVQRALPLLRNEHGFGRYLRVGRMWVYNRKSARPIWLTGHSLGGAAGVLAAWILKQQYGYNVKGVYTIGQPTCGNLAFANGYLAAGLQLHRAVNCSDFVVRCFEDLGSVPLEFTLIAAGVNMGIADRWPAPFDTMLEVIVMAMFTPEIVLSLDLAFMTKGASNLGFAPRHFGTLTYFDRTGKARHGWSDVQRMNDRVQSHVEDFMDALDPFVLPKMPGPFSSPSSWSSYWSKLAKQKAKLFAAAKDPGAIFAKFKAALLRAFDDHGAHPYYARYVFDRTKARNVNMNGLPGRP